MKFSSNMSLKDFAVAVAQELKKHNIEVILTGGAVVSIYSNNIYQSKDLDFICADDRGKVKQAMESMGFKNVGKDYHHPDSQFYVEFPGSTLQIGGKTEKPGGSVKVGKFVLKILSPTQSVMDRLASFYHWKDRQSLEQALFVATSQTIKWEKVKKWSAEEGMSERFKLFLNAYKAKKKK